MELYETYLGLLRDGASEVVGHALRAVLGLGVLSLLGAWLPLALLERVAPPPEAANGFPRDPLALLPLALAGGLATVATVWTLSLLALRSAAPGSVVLYAVAVACAALGWRRRQALHPRGSRMLAWSLTSALALALALWLYAPTALPVMQDVPRLVFSDFQRDLSVHVDMAGLVRDGGLPMHSLWGGWWDDYYRLRHTGYLVLIAGLSDAFGIGLYQAAVMLWIDATLLIAWGAFALCHALPSGVRAGLTLAALVLGAFTFPELHRVCDPMRRIAGGGLEINVPGYWVAGRGFWNLPQTLSIALAMSSLVALDRFAAVRRAGGRALPLLLASTFLLVASGWMKPSLAVFYGPALLLWLALNRAGFAEYASVLATSLGGVAIYMLPAVLHSLPEAKGWSPALDARQVREVVRFLTMATPALLVLAGTPLVRLSTRGWRHPEAQLLDLAMIAAAGSVLFALLFREDRFVGSGVFQPNIWWGMAACLVLLVPLLGREAFAELRRTGARRAIAWVGLAMLALQAFNGACLAVAYPVLNLRAHEQADAQLLAAARARTAPGTRFAIDPDLQDFDLLAYLSRPVAVRTADSSKSELRVAWAWESFCLRFEGTGLDLLRRFDAILVRSSRRHVGSFLASHGWQRETLERGYELWQRAQRPASAR
jgi:hypothetical protein